MTWIDLGIPKPHAQPSNYNLFSWPENGTVALTYPKHPYNTSFFEVIKERRSRRDFGVLDIEDLANVLWFSAHSQVREKSELGFDLELRPVLSSGAIHPIHILVNNPNDSVWYRYEPSEHVLKKLEIPESVNNGLQNSMKELIPREDSTAILFVAEPGKTFAKYSEACSLIWRDTGVLIGHIALVSEALNLNFCPLGITGEPWASQLSEQGNLAGVGIALLGSR